MQILFFCIPVLVLVVLVISGLVSRRKRRLPYPLPYRKHKYLLTRAEHCFFDALIQATRSQHRVFCKVRLLDLIVPDTPREDRLLYLNKISAKHIDFVLCSMDTIRPLLAIELDDASHTKPDRKARDEFKNDALRSAGLPLLRVNVRPSYDVMQLRAQIDDVLSAHRATRNPGAGTGDTDNSLLRGDG